MKRSLLVGACAGLAIGMAGGALILRNGRVQKAAIGRRLGRLRILILGGGFAGYYALHALERRLRQYRELEITLINRENYMLFTSLLHEVAASDVDPANIVNPLHKLVDRAVFFSGEVRKIDLGHKTVVVTQSSTGEERTFEYDYLVIGLGSESNFYNLPGMEENAITMKCLEDAAFLRNHMVNQLETVDFEGGRGDPAGLTFVVC